MDFIKKMKFSEIAKQGLSRIISNVQENGDSAIDFTRNEKTAYRLFLHFLNGTMVDKIMKLQQKFEEKYKNNDFNFDDIADVYMLFGHILSGITVETLDKSTIINEFYLDIIDMISFIKVIINRREKGNNINIEVYNKLIHQLNLFEFIDEEGKKQKKNDLSILEKSVAYKKRMLQQFQENTKAFDDTLKLLKNNKANKNEIKSQEDAIKNIKSTMSNLQDEISAEEEQIIILKKILYINSDKLAKDNKGYSYLGDDAD